ncbi:hypothetical protein [Halomonas sp. DQ26W]|uniref:hypothetical protein n=1 Tax=Halomonas sp. DQ26W TaxID=2282311 RepID=UPI0011C070C3|nr:hypothetical protein [Halomonas sp. DQ26W]
MFPLQRSSAGRLDTTHRALSARRFLEGRPWLAVALLLFATLLAGCMAPQPGADLPPYGESVQHTKALQTYEPGDPVPPLHGAKAAEAMRLYRQAPGGSQAPSSLP